MIQARKLTDEGLEVFKTWLSHPMTKLPPATLLDGPSETEILESIEIDPNQIFGSRYDFGVYLVARLGGEKIDELLTVEYDGLWAWLAVVYFAQLTEKGIRRSEHYVVTRQGVTGSLAYRQAARTSFEMVAIHGAGAMICLSAKMHTFGDITEQLTSRQIIARHRGFFETAFRLYVHDGILQKGASTKVKSPKTRKPKDQAGRGGVRRLTVALKRLDLTYDTDTMIADNMIALLPREFAKWKATTT